MTGSFDSSGESIGIAGGGVGMIGVDLLSIASCLAAFPLSVIAANKI